MQCSERQGGDGGERLEEGDVIYLTMEDEDSLMYVPVSSRPLRSWGDKTQIFYSEGACRQ